MRTRARLLPRDDRHQHAAARAHQPAASRTSPACRCSGTRRSSAATPSPTRPASIRTACSRSARPTRSCGPRTSASRKTDLVLGKHSGRAALADRAKALGYHLTGEQLQEVFDEFKKLADKKKEVYDADIAALIEKRMTVADDQWKLVAYEVHATGKADADGLGDARPRRRERSRKTTTGGDGPLDALFRAIEEITGIDGRRPRLPRPQRHARQGRPGRSDDRSRARRPRVPRPRRLDRHRRSGHAGVPQRHQPRRRRRRPTGERRRGRIWCNCT